ncbi:MAG TPA: hypothetical protein VLC46_25355 [Thermoanaerobaculia bacterium]|jgi:hypothetical protein|nr:hypothetical protein [Thermoanaerobaculia bacterium]
MKTSLKVTVVAGGYVAAFVAASAAVAIRMASNRGDPQASGGMFAFGDSIVFIAVFGVLALVPTAGALYFLRPYQRFWEVLSRLCLAVAVTGLTAVILFAAGSHAMPPSPLVMWAGLSLLRILVAPLLALAFLVCALVTPYRSPRFAFLAATAVEAAVTACAGAFWFVHVFLHRQ